MWSASTSICPTNAVVLSVDEQSQIQALERTQPPLLSGHAATRTPDYTRHGTMTLFAALDSKTGRVLGQCSKRHRHQEFIRGCHGLTLDFSSFPHGASAGVFRCPSLACELAD